ncbi:MAG: SHOCT domain-containing protein [Sedimenticola sp.]
MKLKLAVSAISIAILSGCAGSANHKVVSSHQANDNNLTCPLIEAEIVKTQVIIDGVNKDKEDISGADIIDGIFWFPFNLIAKSDNYNSALTAAGNRIDRLQELQKEKSCAALPEEEQAAAVSKLIDELTELSKLYKSGALTEEEYKAAKQKVLNNVNG